MTHQLSHSYYFINIGGICKARPYLLPTYVVNSIRGVKWAG